MWLHSLKVAQLLRSVACLHTNQSRSYLNHLVFGSNFFLFNDSQNIVIYEQGVFDVTCMILSVALPKKKELSCPEHEAVLCVCLFVCSVLVLPTFQLLNKLTDCNKLAALS